MPLPSTVREIAAAVLAVAAVATPAPSGASLLGRAILHATTFRPDSPPSAALLSPEERTAAERNGVKVPFPAQPVLGISSMIPADRGMWYALADNGYGRRENSADFQLSIYGIDPRFGNSAGARLVASVQLRDSNQHVPWAITDSRSRILTGADFDPESFALARDGTFWIGEEFGPFLLHFDRDGQLLEPPIGVPGVRSPQNPLLKPDEKPNLATSRGFEGMAMHPDGTTLYAMLEGPVDGDNRRDLRIYVFDIAKKEFVGEPLKMRLEDAGHSIGELSSVDATRFLVIERDDLGDGPEPPRFKKIFLLDISAKDKGGRVGKTPVVDLLALADPNHRGSRGDVFQMPFRTIESVSVLDARTILVACDNNFPTSSGRSRASKPDRSGPLSPDDTEIVLIRLETPLYRPHQ
jgi:hypothetical protein